MDNNILTNRSLDSSETTQTAEQESATSLFDCAYQHLDFTGPKPCNIDWSPTDVELAGDLIADNTTEAGRLEADRKSRTEVKDDKGIVLASTDTYYKDGKPIWQSVEDNRVYPPVNYTVLFDENGNEKARRTYSQDPGASTTEFSQNGEKVRVTEPGFFTCGAVEHLDKTSGKWVSVEDPARRKAIQGQFDILDPQISWIPKLPNEKRKGVV